MDDTLVAMNKSYVMTVRLPKELGRDVERYGARTGRKPAQLAALAMDEFMRRRSFPLIDFRDTAAGRVAYVKGTRLAVYWLVDAVRRMRGKIDVVAETWGLTVEKIKAALHYAETYPQEIKALREHAEANRAALVRLETALARSKGLGRSGGTRKPKARRVR